MLILDPNYPMTVSIPPDVQLYVDGIMENHRYVFDFDHGSMY